MSALAWDDAWFSALYAKPSGLYRRDAPGKHFATAAQGIPNGTDVLAAALLRLARREGLCRIVDLGAGRGELATALARQDPAVQVAAVDVVARPRGLPRAVAWHVAPGGADLGAPTGLAEPLRDALVVAVEWLDVVPCPVLEIDDRGVPRVVLVATPGTERPGTERPGTERLGAEAGREDLEWCARWWPPRGLPTGARIEVGRTRDAAWAGLLGRMRGGLALAIDYGHTRATRPTYGTLVGYRDGRVVAPVPDGTCDLTAHVAVDSLAQVARTSQRVALADLGVTAVPPDLALATTNTPEYAAKLAVSATIGRLKERGGLGDFHWITARP